MKPEDILKKLMGTDPRKLKDKQEISKKKKKKYQTLEEALKESQDKDMSKWQFLKKMFKKIEKEKKDYVYDLYGTNV